MKRKSLLLFLTGGLAAILFLFLFNKGLDSTSSNTFCGACHAHPHAHSSLQLSVHNSNRSGISATC
ncbi:MAG: NapC/NirT family cytochrome c, partial [Mariniphaga sp.]|nr:NapC/NirT family cytochrome c [Mariniphaga sp.]